MRVLLVRHAQSEWQRAASDDRDTALTEDGARQAALLAAWLATGPALDAGGEPLTIGTVFCSGLRRARDTATVVGDRLGRPVVVDTRLDEATFHVAQDVPRHPDPLSPPAPRAPTARYAAYAGQAHGALTALCTEAVRNGATPLAVTHGGLIKTLLRHVLASDAASVRAYNTGLTLIEWQGGRWHLVCLNVADHLPATLRTR